MTTDKGVIVTPDVCLTLARGYARILLLSVLAAVVLLMAIAPSIWTLSALAVAACLAALVYPVSGASAWVMVVPLENYVVNIIGVSPFIILIPAVVAGMVSNMIIAERRLTGMPGARFALSLLIAFMLSAIASDSLDIGQLRMIVSAALMLIMSLSIAWSISTDELGIWVVGHASIVAAIITVYIGLGTGDVSWRIAVGDNVRLLANSVGVALIFVVSALMQTSSKDHPTLPYQGSRASLLVIAIMCVASIAATVSRGVMAAIVIVLICSSIGSIVFNDSQSRLRTVARNGSVLLLVAVVGIVLVPYIDQLIAGGRLMERILLAWYNPEENLRWTIWASAIGGMAQAEWIIGSGPGTFRALAQSAGYDFYAHSVYIDIFVSTGIIGVGVLLAYIMYVFWNVVNHKSVLGLALCLFLLIGFVTHGSASTKEFWVLLGTVSGLNYRYRIKARRIPS